MTPQTAGVAAAAPYVITSKALGAGEVPPASDRIVMGGIGIGNMGTGDQGAFVGRPDVQYVAVCDVRKGMLEAAKGRVDEHYQNRDARHTAISESSWLATTLMRSMWPRPTIGTQLW